MSFDIEIPHECMLALGMMPVALLVSQEENI